MPKLKTVSSTPKTIVVDIKNHPDADAMIKIASSLKGVKIEPVKKSSMVVIKYPTQLDRLGIQMRMKKVKKQIKVIEANILTPAAYKNEHKSDDDSSITRLYNAVILK